VGCWGWWPTTSPFLYIFLFNKTNMHIFENSNLSCRSFFNKATNSPGIQPKLAGIWWPGSIQIVASLSLHNQQKVNPTLIASSFRIRARFDEPFTPPRSGRRDLCSGPSLRIIQTLLFLSFPESSLSCVCL